MELPTQLSDLLQRELSNSKDSKDFIDLILRKEGQALPKPYESLPPARQKKLLGAWYAFHKHFSYSSFRDFYSKSSFCSQLSLEQLPKDRATAKHLLLSLLADRKFLFLEYNEHFNAPDYPPMSEIIRKPARYLSSVDPTTKANSETVFRQGFVPTYAHAGEYDRMLDNYNELTAAIRERERNRAKEEKPGAVLDMLCHKVCFHIVPFNGTATQIEKDLCLLFRNYLESAVAKAYSPQYEAFSAQPWETFLPAVHQALAYLEMHPALQAYQTLILFSLFTQRTKKLAKQTLAQFQFMRLVRKAAHRPPQQDQEITRRKIEHQIKLFDALLLLLPPEDPEFIKYLFYQYTQYSGYFHFFPPQGSDHFVCLPNPKDSVDQLGGAFRRHILYCIPNDVGWLTPGLPNDRTKNAEALATLLLRDAAFLPVYTRLTDRVRRLLKESAVKEKLTAEYQAACANQKEIIALLSGWCFEYGLEFIGEDSFLDHSNYPESLRKLCSRFVLEHAIKEYIYRDARNNLSQAAQALWGDLCLEGELFQIV